MAFAVKAILTSGRGILQLQTQCAKLGNVATFLQGRRHYADTYDLFYIIPFLAKTSKNSYCNFEKTCISNTACCNGQQEGKTEKGH